MPALDAESWLTPQRLERMTQTLRVVQHAGRTGIRQELAERTIWKNVGGPLTDVPDLVQVLRSLDLFRLRPPHLQVTKEGRQVANQDHQQGGRLLASRIIARGLLLNQGRLLVESSELNPAGDLQCRRDLAISLAPQLTGLLRRFPDVEFGQHLVVPRAFVTQLDNAWIPAESQGRLDHRKLLGDRGEEFAYRFERDRAHDRTKIHWVSQDDDGLGYDIEDTNGSTSRRIEVKTSSSKDVRFFLSTNEWQVASEDPASYEVQFWGEVNLNAQPAEEYQRLRAAGYPLIFGNLADHVQSGRLILEPSHYLVTDARKR
jgi:hypothetical protein